jgi:hypothetical protein
MGAATRTGAEWGGPAAAELRRFGRVCVAVPAPFLRHVAVRIMAENTSIDVVQRVVREVKALVARPPDGVRYVPGEALTEVLADINGPGA